VCEFFRGTDVLADHLDDPARLLNEFRKFVARLGTQPVTTTVSSLVQDMLTCYATRVEESEHPPFAWGRDVSMIVEEFVLTRDCFIYLPGHAPYVEATFAVVGSSDRRTLDVEIFFGLALPRLCFVDLCNVVSEGNRLRIEPSISRVRQWQGVLPMEATYFIGPAEDWLQWNKERERFEGNVPTHLAANAGSERQDAYTIPMELTATITKHFPAGIRFERVIRIALPLTVRRRPSRCLSSLEFAGPGYPERVLAMVDGQLPLRAHILDDSEEGSDPSAWSLSQPSDRTTRKISGLRHPTGRLGSRSFIYLPKLAGSSGSYGRSSSLPPTGNKTEWREYDCKQTGGGFQYKGDGCDGVEGTVRYRQCS